MKLDGKVVLVTGAGRNIGRAIAALCAAEGARLIIGTAADRASLEDTARLCRERGAGHVLQVTGDVARPEDCAVMVATALDRFGRIDALVNPVAIRPRLPFADVTWDQWRRVLDVNLGGMFNLCKLVVPGMIEQKSGSIVAFGGMNAMTAGGAGPNSAAKMGLLGFVRSLAIDLAPHNVRVNMVVPGRIATEGREDVPVDDIPMARRGTPGEIASATLFLVSDDSAYLTGDRLMVTGGRANL
jgi:3-oxoacyl-[acyl-carrier protein] reductase